MARKKDDPRAATSVDRTIGLRIRSRRAELGVSQTQLADAIGVTFQQVQKYEKGVNRVAASTLIDIAKALKAAPTALLPAGADGEPADDPLVLELAPTLALLNAEGRRILLKMVKGLAADDALCKSRRDRG